MPNSILETGTNLSPNNPTTNNIARHASIVELLSTPPQLPIPPRNLQSQINQIHDLKKDTTHDLKRDNSNSSINSNSTSISNLSINSITQDNLPIKDNNQNSIHHITSNLNTNELLSSVHNHKWQFIKLSQLIEKNKLITIPNNYSIEESFNTLMKYTLTSCPVMSNPNDMNCLTFDYNDLNSYLLLVLNKFTINDPKKSKLIMDCQSGKPVPVGEIIQLTPKDPFYKLSENDNLSNVISILGSGVHRIAITNNEMTQLKGILSQRRLIKYLWDNARSFSDLEPLLNKSLQSLKIGIINNDHHNSNNNNTTSKVISIQDDQPLIQALFKMHKERISSIAVVDICNNLIGNISVTDVKHVTRTSQYPLLNNTCRHFISIILNFRGLENGKDSFPIFHVYPSTSLSRTLAKLVATQSHRLWIVQPPESTLELTLSNSSDDSNHLSSFTSENAYKPRGKLIGVVSLTDILNLLATRQTEHKEIDPQSARRMKASSTESQSTSGTTSQSISHSTSHSTSYSTNSTQSISENTTHTKSENANITA
ncbi:hypothetical protein TBLA_0A09940 [Henningerozyma blattae CBS 6284]|uniref:CBS domain-containing protein n=1 Tax=Henningerozyma blattae (strain ATCC 34711 / CBS 6284 / DSM 70876 / NBRC 10599 / NRRL Y-10934 / UCD 77-7) TaxID=1071380 RepID=I2GXC3_HENB6|nr:hypothetical protein TBLA_0A09940 [Tetrapisispora blattae CBS 6284]CCH58775.1 hypothetical protein TBLA_0A09940 [Tetrapisispora blattae CBS 6284]